MKSLTRSFSQIALISIWLFANFYFAGCRDRNQRKTANTDSSKTTASTTLSEDTSLINQGKSLFINNCGKCHSVWKTDNHLAGIVERLGVDYLKLYLTKQDSLIMAKNEYAVEMKKSYKDLASVHNYKFSNEQLNAIIAYLKKYSP